jgi:hypothetical protein
MKIDIVVRSELTGDNTCSALGVTAKSFSPGPGRRRTHGMSQRPIYYTWKRMKGRCYRPNDSDYRWYGARGIEVCERWRNSFAAFYADMGERPSPQHSIDRINNDGHYEPANCRWATAGEQNRNKRGPLLRGLCQIWGLCQICQNPFMKRCKTHTFCSRSCRNKVAYMRLRRARLSP